MPDSARQEGSATTYGPINRRRFACSTNQLSKTTWRKTVGWMSPERERAAYTVTCVPTSTTRPVGIWKKSDASLADRAKAIKRRSSQREMPARAWGLSARRERKNDVDMISKCQPSLRVIPSALGTLGVSINPNRSVTRMNRGLTGTSSTRSLSATRGVSVVLMVRITLCSCRTLLCLRLWSSAVGAEVGSLVRNIAVPGTRCGGFFFKAAQQRLKWNLGTLRLLCQNAGSPPP